MGDIHSHEILKLCVSGAAEISHCGIDTFERAKELGAAIAEGGHVLLTGATTGFPHWASVGFKELGGTSIGFSPATNESEHVEEYGLPLDYMDLIVYTGFGYSGRNLILTRSSDAVFIGCGRIGTINEFTIAYEDQKPIGILEGAWQTDEVIQNIMEHSNRESDKIIIDADPKVLVKKVVELVLEDKIMHSRVYENYYNGVGGERQVIR